ncbi:MAG: helix-hairpin-helix domain-containing protein [Pseudomonadota bacterium]
MILRPPTRPTGPLAENAAIARRLEEASLLLDEQNASRFRVAAYARAAEAVRALDRPLREIFDEGGRKALIELEGIGESISRAVVEMLSTGRWAQLERMRGAAEPEALFATLPGVGPVLAAAIHEELHVDALPALEVAAHDGRLEALRGVGPKKAAAIREALAARLSRRRTPSRGAEPSVRTLLAIDRAYRRAAAAEALPRIAPARFNPSGAAWLPIMHMDRDGWSFTALFSNTALAHRLGRTNDWVVIAFARDHAEEGQLTAVTETRGPLAGRRVIRGRERECRDVYGVDPGA